MSGDRKRSDDELARTATAAGSDPLPREAIPLGEQLGRYKIQRELGRGGMGVVYAVFDPDLERKVALKVLRGAGDSAEARQRLLREARAMARLTHPNVLTVHEVGSAGGQDFIAMELIDGSTLDEWLAGSRSEREIIAAFMLAGRGLAAAHAAGLVHRDFKPRNVLRHKDGRIVVTDFGLVVGVAQQVDVLTTTLPHGATADSSTTPSSLSGLTQTGALLGTPAYMAPEQWSGGTVGPPADQFAFCVALWEALAKDRPYKGTTLEELQDQVTHAKRSDESRLPRKLRPILRRGLDPDPAKRYPSMDALLAAIGRAERRPVIPIAIGVAALIGVATVALIAQSRHAPVATGPSCRAPVIALDKVWSPGDRDRLRAAHQVPAAEAFERDFALWTDARAHACKAAPDLMSAQLACLDGVLGRMALAKTALLETHPASVVDLSEQLLDPRICDKPTPPRLAPMTSAQMHEVAVMSPPYHDRLTEQEATKLLADVKTDPCAVVYATIMLVNSGAAGSERPQLVAQADKYAPACGDDRALADAAITQLRETFVSGDPSMSAKIDRIQALVAAVGQADLFGEVLRIRTVLAGQTGHLDEVIDDLDRAAGFLDLRDATRRAARTRLDLARYRWQRGSQADLKAVPTLFAESRDKLVAAFGEKDADVRFVDGELAGWIWASGDIAKGDALRASTQIVRPSTRPFPARGKVLDEAGAPVANAVVTVGRSFDGDSLSAAMAMGDQWTAKTDATGRFEIADADSDSIAIAQLGDKRSAPEHVLGPDVTLVLKPTSRVSGKVLLRDKAPSLVIVAVSPDPPPADMTYTIDAPVQPDGTFTIDGVPRGRLRFMTQATDVNSNRINVKVLTVSQPVVENVQLEVKASTGRVRVLVRSIYGDELSMAYVFMLAGKYPAETTMAKVTNAMQNANFQFASGLTPEDDSPIVHAKSKKGDLFVVAENRPEGTASVCAMPLPKKIDDPGFEGLRLHSEKIPVRCVPLGAKDDVIVVEVPPWPRFD